MKGDPAAWRGEQTELPCSAALQPVIDNLSQNKRWRFSTTGGFTRKHQLSHFLREPFGPASV